MAAVADEKSDTQQAPKAEEAEEARVAEARTEEVPVTVVEKPAIKIGHGELLHAIEKNVQENSVSVQIAGVGTVRLPALDSLAWIGGLATLAAFGLLEWPVATAIGVGHLLSRQRHLRLLRDFGEALEGA